MRNFLRRATAVGGAVIAIAAVAVSPAGTQPRPCTNCNLSMSGAWSCGPAMSGVWDPHFCMTYGGACELLSTPDCVANDHYAADGSVVGEVAAESYALLPGEDLIVIDTRDRLASELQSLASRRACDGVIVARSTDERAAESARRLTRTLTL